jgi:hypothetical protein
MRVSVTSISLLAPFLTVILALLSACGGSQPAASLEPVDGPALIFFYTDN